MGPRARAAVRALLRPLNGTESNEAALARGPAQLTHLGEHHATR